MSLRTSICGECGSPLREDQRYCLECGARHGAPRVDALGELSFAAQALAGPSAAEAREPVPARQATPSRRLTVALAAATLALGGVAGAAIGPAPEGAVAGAAAPARVVALVVPAASAPPVTTTTTTTTDDAEEDEPPATTSDDDADASPTPAPEAAEEEDDDAPSSTEPSDTAPASTTAPSSTTPAATVPAYVWLVSLPAADAATAFGPSSPLAPLVAQGVLLSGYSAAGPTPASNQLALLGGQVPTADCAADLPACVLPAGETSLPDQLVSIGLTWRAYVEDAAQRCTTGPAARVGPSLFTTLVQRGDCATTTVGPDRLPTDLKAIDATPALSLVVAATNDSGKAVADQVLASEAYKKDGVLVLAPDAPGTDPAAPTGALVLAPKAAPGTTDATATGPVALLRSLDGLFGLDPLGLAAQATAGALDPIFPPTNPSNPTRRSP